jgi:hypothetical protein
MRRAKLAKCAKIAKKRFFELFFLGALGVLAFLARPQPSYAAASVRVSQISPTTRPIATFDLIEWRVELDRSYDNPFDPEQIAVDATFTAPDGKTLRVPAFWCGPPADKTPSFHVRFAAAVAGAWKTTVSARDAHGESQSEEIPIEVIAAAAANSKGFIRRSERSPRYFQFDSGKAYLPIGLNLAWPGKEGLSAYEDWFSRLSSNGGNFARIWICHPNYPYETKQAGPGKYDQDACGFYDAMLESAQRHGIHCMLTFNNHRDLLIRDEYGMAQWPEQPYNAINGGPCATPAEFITNPEAHELYRRRLRYSVARWSAYTSVFCWEFWNEQTFTRVEIPPLWTQKMARHLKSIDPFGHPVSTSFGQIWQDEVWKMPEIDLTQEHLYPGASCRDASGPVTTAIHELRDFNKPALVAELGIGDVREAEVDPNGLGTNLHNAMWSSIMSGSCGATALWWWDNYVAPKGLWWQFKPIATFVNEVDWIDRRFEPVQLDPPLAAERSEWDSFTDVFLTGGGGWTRSHGQPIVVSANGQPSLNLPRYIYGPVHADFRTPTLLQVDLPQPTQVIVRVGTVSDVAVLRILVDDQAVKDFAFSALPGGGGEVKPLPPRGRRHSPPIYNSVFNKDCAVDVPAGKHTIEIQNAAGDWFMLDSVTLPKAKASRYADLHAFAMRDAAAGETIGWLHDPESNWFNDRDGKHPRTITGATLTVPSEAGAQYRVEWWDTWKGGVIRSDEVTSTDSTISLKVPPVTRDLAFRATRLKTP